VPGPRVPLYLQGARLSYLSAIMPVADGMGLVFSVTSYSDMLIVSFTACYEQLPDPELLAQCLRDSFQEYLALVQSPAQAQAERWRWWRPASARPPGSASTKAPRRKPAARACIEMQRSPHIEYESLGDPAHPAIVLIMGLGMQLVAWPDSLLQGAGRARLPRDPLRQPRCRPFRARAGKKRPNLVLAMAAAALHLPVRTPTRWRTWPTTPTA
jgi:hypothetical protein